MVLRCGDKPPLCRARDRTCCDRPAHAASVSCRDVRDAAEALNLWRAKQDRIAAVKIWKQDERLELCTAAVLSRCFTPCEVLNNGMHVLLRRKASSHGLTVIKTSRDTCCCTCDSETWDSGQHNWRVQSRPGSPGQPELDGEMRKSGVGCLPECGENPARRSPSIVDSLKRFPNFQRYSCTTRQGGRAVDVVRKRFT